MRIAVAVASTLSLAALSGAQEAIHTTAATQPGVGRWTLREQLHWYSSDSQGTRIDELLLDSTLFLGVRNDTALGISVPSHSLTTDTPTGSSSEGDLGDVQLLGKYRVYRKDSGPLDTERASVTFGLHCDTAGDGATSLRPDFARGEFDPMLGVVWTQIDGRVGLNAAAEATLSTTGEASDFRYDGAWLYRLAPHTFATGSDSAWYLVAEANGRYETNGDHELLLSPGLLYEGKRFAFELSAQLPVLQDVDRRAEIDVAVVVGMRFLF